MRECYCKKCDWEGSFSEAPVKHFGEYYGEGDNWGWEEWDNLVCPKCGSILEYCDSQEELLLPPTISE